MNKWHTMSVDSVFNDLKTSKNGLSTSKAQARLREYGLNKLKEKILLFMMWPRLS